MSFTAHVLEDYSGGAPLHSAAASPLSIVALPAGTVGGRELSFNVTFWDAMEDFLDDADSKPLPTSVSQEKDVDLQNEEETKRTKAALSEKKVPITELIVTNVTPPAEDVMGQIISKPPDRVAPAKAEFEEDPDRIEDDETRNDAFGFIEDLADTDDQFYDVGMGAFAEQDVD